MFFFRKFFGLLFLGFLIFGILGLFGRAGAGRYHSAYQQGFIAGQQAAASSAGTAAEEAGESTTAVPNGYSYPGANVYWRGHGFFFPGFGLLFCLVPFFFLGLLFMGFGRRRWHGHHRHRGPCGHGSWKHGPRRHGEDWVDSSQEKSPDDIDDGPDEPIMRA